MQPSKWLEQNDAYIINDLGAPTAYFAFVSAVAAITGALVQRSWGRYGDHQGPKAMIFFSGALFGLAIVVVQCAACSAVQPAARASWLRS